MRISPALKPFNAVRFRTSLSTKTNFEAKLTGQMGRWESVVLFALCAALATLADLERRSRVELGLRRGNAAHSPHGHPCESGHKTDWKMLIPVGSHWCLGIRPISFGCDSVPLRDAQCRAAVWPAYAAVAFSARRYSLLRQRLETWLEWFCWFAVGIGLVSVLAYYTSPGKIFWMFPAAYPDNWGPFPSRNNFAQFLELSFPVAVYQFDRIAIPGGKNDTRWLAGLPPAILFACGIASASRAGSLMLVLEAFAWPCSFGREEVEHGLDWLWRRAP